MARILLSLAFFMWGGIVKSASVYLDGYIIKNNGIAEKCFIKVPYGLDNNILFSKLMDYVIVRDSKERVMKYKAKHLKGFSFNLKGKKYEFVSFENTININVPFKRNVFMCIEEKGLLNLYRYYYKDVIVSPIATVTANGSIYFISKSFTDLVKLEDKSDLIQAISDDHELCKSLEKSSILSKDISSIVKRYNSKDKQDAIINALYKMHDE